MYEFDKQVAEEIMGEILKPVIDQFVKMAVDYLAKEAYKQDKGRHQPFWTRQWRKS